MDELFVTYEISKKLKEKGFTLGFNLYGYKPIYTDVDKIALIWDIGSYEKDYFGKNIPCPTISQVMKWLRDEKYIVFGITPMQENAGDCVCWCITIYTVVDYGYGLIFEEELHCYSYEEAAMTGIKYSLDNLI